MKCHVCQQEIKRKIDPSKLRRNKHNFCSRSCYIVFWANQRTGENSKRWKKDNQRTCIVCKTDFRSSLRSGNVPKYCSMKCYNTNKIGMFAGSKNGTWKGGITEVSSKIRHSEEYIEWRNACGTRDKVKCQICGDRKKLVVHHIKTFKDFPELRFEVSNGITLCRACHMKLHAKHRGITDFTNILNDYTPSITSKRV